MPDRNHPIASGRRIHGVFVQNKTTVSVDGEPFDTWTDASPSRWQVSIEPATVRSLERITAGTVLSLASHVVTGPYRADVTTLSRLLHNGRALNVLGTSDPEERHVELICACAEVVT